MTYSEAFPLWVAEGKVPRRTGTRSVRKRVRTTTAMSFTPKLRLFDMKLHRRETEGR